MNIRHIAVLLSLAVPLTGMASEHRLQLREALDWRQGMEVSFENLAGTATVGAAPGNQVVFEVEVVGATEALARQLTLRQERRGNKVEVWVEYPTRDHSEFRYGAGRWSGNTTLTYRGERVRISSRAGADVHANVRVLIPNGANVELANHVGTVTAEGVRATLGLRTASGSIAASQGGGALTVHSGSGSVAVRSHEGAIHARTGSGSVSLEAVTGDVDANTGSGGIRAERVAGDTIRLRTGSGSVRIEDARGGLNVGTGSGSVRIGDLAAGTELTVSTGSGSVNVGGDLARVTNLRISTGSGSITVNSTGVPNVKLVASAGSGSVNVDAANMRDVSTRRNRFEGTLGTGEGDARLTTGSGSIRFNAGR